MGPYAILAILFRPLVLLLPKLIWLSNISISSVPGDVYSRNASCILNLISTFLLINYIHKLFFCRQLHPV